MISVQIDITITCMIYCSASGVDLIRLNPGYTYQVRLSRDEIDGHDDIIELQFTTKGFDASNAGDYC